MGESSLGLLPGAGVEVGGAPVMRGGPENENMESLHS